MDVLVNVDGVLSGHHLGDGRKALLATLLCGSHSAGPKVERKGARDCGMESRIHVQLPGHGLRCISNYTQPPPVFDNIDSCMLVSEMANFPLNL